ncbi:MAG: hypothetical protein ACXABY_16620 [Candidatus Thorarchaeota archaeon]|jgi:rubrerythrin
MIHERLKEIYDEFDHHCRINNVDYSIDADYFNVQGYRLLDSKNITDVLRHMSNFVKNKWVDLSYDGNPVSYDELKSTNFAVPTYNPLFKFTLQPIQEDEMQEDSIKGPTNKMARSQHQHPSSFRKNKAGLTYETEGAPKKKKKTKDDDPFEVESFDARLENTISEMDLSFKEPDILFTRNEVESDDELEDKIDRCIELEKETVRHYLDAMESANNEEVSAQLELMIEGCANRVKTLTEMRDGKWQPQPLDLNF